MKGMRLARRPRPATLPACCSACPQEARGCNYIWEQVLHVQESSSPRGGSPGATPATAGAAARHAAARRNRCKPASGAVRCRRCSQR